MKILIKKIITLAFFARLLGLPSTTAAATIAQKTIPQFSHIAVVVLENHSYAQVVGSKTMPYLNTLIQKYGLAQNYFANTHPSIGNYFMLTTGKLITRNDNFKGTTTENNLARELTAAGKTWRVYAEGLPKIGYLGGNSKRYLKRHNPFAYFNDVRNNPAEAQKLVPFINLAKDISTNRLPNFSFIIPDACNDAHDCGLATADRWLKKNIAPLMSNKTFSDNGLLAIVFDEGKASDRAHGGGHDPVILVSSKIKSGYKSTALYQHQNLLKTVLAGLGMPAPLGAAATATPMADFFK